MTLRFRRLELRRTHLKTRMPFRYGVATMTGLPHVFLRATVEIDGRTVEGQSAENLPPRWFTKDTTRHPDEEIRDMLEVIRNACALAIEAGPAEAPFDLWLRIYEAQTRWAGKRGHLPPLLVGLGVSVVEKALIDAVCRRAASGFGAALRSGLLGTRLGAVHPELDGTTVGEWLPERSSDRVAIRHTVGLSDPLDPADLGGDATVPDDGLPRTLEESIRAYGLRFFKVKVQGDLTRDFDRLTRIARIVSREAPGARFTLDGNEQYEAVQPFRELWERVSVDPLLGTLREGLLHVEQPFRRDIALEVSLARELRRWQDRPPIIIDESDGEFRSMPRALDAGYSGCSYKSCKGVFHGVANTCLAAARRRSSPGTPVIISAEDLAGVGPIALLQDTAAVAALGVGHAERNGHHYFRGLSMFPEEIQGQVLTAHGDLYERRADGLVALRIRGGELQLATLGGRAFGCVPLIDTARFDLVAGWE